MIILAGMFFALTAMSHPAPLPAFPPQPEERVAAVSEPPEYQEYEELVLHFARPHQDSGKSWNEDVFILIGKYYNLLKRYPNSPLVPTIKLRIAELFSLLTVPSMESFLNERRDEYRKTHPHATIDELLAYDRTIEDEIPMEIINEEFRPMLKKLLDDIIANHTSADHFSMHNFQFSYDGEKAAALALYYRGLFFKEKRIEDWGRVNRDYPGSKDANRLIDLQRSGKKR